MSANSANSVTPKHEIFGVCRRLGEDFGFHPNILRVALAIGLVWSIEGVALAYLTMAAIVIASRMLAPEPRQMAQAATPAAPAEVAPVSAEQNNTLVPALSQAA